MSEVRKEAVKQIIHNKLVNSAGVTALVPAVRISMNVYTLNEEGDTPKLYVVGGSTIYPQFAVNPVTPLPNLIKTGFNIDIFSSTLANNRTVMNVILNALQPPFITYN